MALTDPRSGSTSLVYVLQRTRIGTGNVQLELEMYYPINRNIIKGTDNRAAQEITADPHSRNQKADIYKRFMAVWLAAFFP